MEVFNQHAKMHSMTVQRRFGSWWAALRRAGLSISNLGKRYSHNDYFENLLSVWTHYGRQPKYGEMDVPPSCIPSGAYEAKWGTWTKALLAFLEQVGSHSPETESSTSALTPIEEGNTEPAPCPRTAARVLKGQHQRQIKLGLRYEVLRRDRFRCVLCGASPATDVHCDLHVDHIVPYSKGGKTAAENLRTVCKQCNLGKSAKLESP